jgi:DNA-binding transcriptional ArsR family regulator
MSGLYDRYLTMHEAGDASIGRAGTVRARGLRHAHPDDVDLQTALDAIADPVRRMILRQLAASPDWTRPCGTFDLPVTKATGSHHFAALRMAGLIEQRDAGRRRLNRLRREEFDRRFPGLLALVLGEDGPRRRAR